MKVVLGITGSIAAYKSPELIRILKKLGHEVRCILSDGGAKFVTPATLEALSGHPVTTSFWSLSPGEIGHIELADWADVVLVAPASADAIAKIRAGIADEPLYATVLATKVPLVIAPAMNVHMWDAAATVENIATLRSRGVEFVDPENGELACGWIGSGRLASLERIAEKVLLFAKVEGELLGKKILVVTGPTREYIDPVRFISNESSGLMGLALVEQAVSLGAEVSVVSGPVALKYPSRADVTTVVSAQEMLSQSLKALNKKPDVVIMCAAVADVRPVQISKNKIKKSIMPKNLSLIENPDIISTLVSKNKNKRGIFVGFNVETGSEGELIKESQRKCQTKGLHLVVGNLAKNSFGKATNEVVLVNSSGLVEKISTSPKADIAKRILTTALAQINR